MTQPKLNKVAWLISVTPSLRRNEESPEGKYGRHPRPDENSIQLVVGSRIIREEQCDAQDKARCRTEKNREAKD